MKKVIITGANGFAGSHLADFLLTMKEIEVFGIIRSRLSDRKNISHLLDQPRFHTIECDLIHEIPVAEAIEKIKPDFVFHLAAQSFVPLSWKDPRLTVETNILGVINLLEAIRKYCPKTKIFICGTAEEYGPAEKSLGPIDENRPLNANNPYGVTKVAQELMAKIYHQSYGLNICLARPFAHEGPRRGKDFATSDFALQVIAIEKGLRKPVIYYGSLETERDYTHVQDIVKSYWFLMQKFSPGQAYNICTGKPTTIKELIYAFLEASGFKRNEVILKKHPDLKRPTQATYLVGNPAKLHSTIDYHPKLKLSDICKDMLDYWRDNFEELPYWKKRTK